MRRCLATFATLVLLWVVVAELNHGLSRFHVFLFAGGLFVAYAALALPWAAGLAAVLAAGMVCDANAAVPFGTHTILFAAAHGRNPGLGGPGAWLSLLNLFLAGLLLGLAYVRTRSLALSMGLHLAWNWTQGTLLGFQVSGTASQGLFRPVLQGRPDWLTGGAFGLEGSLPCAVLCAGFCLLLASRKQNNPKYSI